jgi:hypothetical protein
VALSLVVFRSQSVGLHSQIDRNRTVDRIVPKALLALPRWLNRPISTVAIAIEDAMHVGSCWARTLKTPGLALGEFTRNYDY